MWGIQGAPEGDVVQAHASQHEQEAVSQHLVVVFTLLLPRPRPLRPHAGKLGPVPCVGRFPRAVEETAMGVSLLRRT